MARRTRFTELDVVKFRPVYYEGPKKKVDHDVGVDILILYITCGLGYSPIRHILGLKNDKLIEDVIRQHRLGRSLTKKEDGYKECRLRCKSASKLDELSTQIVTNMSEKYNTKDDDYVYKMLTTGTWSDDPVGADYHKCKKCGMEINPDWVFCPKCATRLKASRPKSLLGSTVD